MSQGDATAIVEASAPCALRLGAGLGLALDRRVSCRLELGGTPGVEIEVKDALVRVRAERAQGLPSDGVAGWLAALVAASGLDGPLRLSTHARVPESTGLGVQAALAASVGAALLAAAGLPDTHEAIAALLRRGAPELPSADLWVSLLGGAVVLNADGRGVRLPVDPARLEEGLLLVETGLAAPSVGDSAWWPGADAGALESALRQGVSDRIAAELGRSPSEGPPSDVRVAGLLQQARDAGAAAWLCAQGASGLLAIWTDPDRRRELLEAARRAGLRPVGCRLDLLGLEREWLASAPVRG